MSDVAARTPSPDRPLRVVHLSDTHLLADGARHHGVVDTTAALRAVLDRAAAVADVDVVVLSGDLSDDGTPASYRALADLVGPWAARRGAVVVPATGNHDARAAFEQVLGPRERTVLVRGFRLVTVDTAVPGAGYGRVDGVGLARLRAALAGAEDPGVEGPDGAAPDGAGPDGAGPDGAGPGGAAPAPARPSVVVLHHAPVPARSALLAALELQDPDALLAVCAAAPAPGVRALLAGHYHHALVARARGLPVVVAPGVANASDPFAPPGHERAVTGSGFAVVDVPAAGDPEVVVVPVPHAAGVPDGTELFDLGPDEVARVAALAGPRG